MPNGKGSTVKDLHTKEGPAWLKKIQLKEIDYSYAALDKALFAVNSGVKRCHLISHCNDGALLEELFTREGSGTMITQENFETLRPATIDDVAGILNVLRPLEDNGTLVRRSRERLEMEISQFVVLQRYDLIIGCAALYPFTYSAGPICRGSTLGRTGLCGNSSGVSGARSRPKIAGLH